MSQHLLQIHIGPMQAFIAAARRTRDLWFGSWLMSELSKAAARGIAELAGEQSLIFPAATIADLQPGTSLAVANKIVALVDDPTVAACQAKAALMERLTALRQDALDGLERALDTWETAVNQIDSLPEFYWVAVPLPNQAEYPRVRQEAEMLLAARKNCRQFRQPSWGSNRPKSSLDGARESVIPEKTAKDAQKMYGRFRAKAAEQLSGVDLLKRLGKATGHAYFPSTSHMASMPLRISLENADAATQLKVRTAWQKYLNTLTGPIKDGERTTDTHTVFGDADGALLFASRLRDYYADEELKAQDKALAAFYEESELPQPLPYYAILMGDGDRMGETINSLGTHPAHRQFSGVLAQFASEAQEIVTQHGGTAVYTGGDDVLALLPLHTALDCAKALADAFRTMMQTNNYDATFSAGVAIFHHLEPLEDGLNEARRAEKAAKSVPGKNALAVVEAKRSGAPRLVKGKWGEVDKRLLAIGRFYQQDALPHGLAYQLREAYLRLGGETAVATDPALHKVVRLEAGRLVKRKEGSEAAQTYMENELVSLLGDNYSMEQLANELIIANSLAQTAEQANVLLSAEEA